MPQINSQRYRRTDHGDLVPLVGARFERRELCLRSGRVFDAELTLSGYYVFRLLILIRFF